MNYKIEKEFELLDTTLNIPCSVDLKNKVLLRLLT